MTTGGDIHNNISLSNHSQTPTSKPFKGCFYFITQSARKYLLRGYCYPFWPELTRGHCQVTRYCYEGPSIVTEVWNWQVMKLKDAALCLLFDSRGNMADHVEVTILLFAYQIIYYIARETTNIELVALFLILWL